MSKPRFRLDNNGACGDPECCGEYRQYVADKDGASLEVEDAVKVLNQQDAEIAQLRAQLEERNHGHEQRVSLCLELSAEKEYLKSQLAAAEAKIARVKDVCFLSVFTPSNQVKQLVLVDEVMEALADTEAQ